MLKSCEEKFSLGEMILGGICSRALIPSDKPIFVSDLYKECELPHLNIKMYSAMVKEKAGPAIKAMYPDMYVPDPSCTS